MSNINEEKGRYLVASKKYKIFLCIVTLGDGFQNKYVYQLLNIMQNK